MSAVPTRRLFVYIAVGLVVLVVGTFGLLSMRGGATGSADELVIDAGDGAESAGGGGSAGDFSTDGIAVQDVSGGGVSQTGVSTASPATTTTQMPQMWVQVAGAVRRPGVYEVPAGSRVFQAVLQAGGFADEADQEAVALAALLTDGCRIYIPREGESGEGGVETPTQSSAGVTGGMTGEAPSGGTSKAGVVSLNSATLEELDTLPGIGPSLAQQIISYREANGPFTSVDQLTDVPGIGPAKLEQLRPLVEL